ncbi:Fatty acyl-CoA reductase wat [Fusarium oxysporum f. sp. albedinis]|nr:Fatty acyl-CoA reductase wat [Fusarium oxysporum f. sp. albedinis]
MSMWLAVPSHNGSKQPGLGKESKLVPNHAPIENGNNGGSWAWFVRATPVNTCINVTQVGAPTIHTCIFGVHK